MKVILIANSKGGAGKTTLSTNLAGCYAGQGLRTVLADWDRQKSAAAWLARRPASAPLITLWDAKVSKAAIAKLDPQVMIVDSPAGLHGPELKQLAERAAAILVPVMPSAFDMDATSGFLSELQSIAPEKAAIVGMRVSGHYKSAEELDAYLAGIELPVVTHLRNSQIYVQCARDGLSVFDLPPSRADTDWAQWAPLTEWLDGR